MSRLVAQFDPSAVPLGSFQTKAPNRGSWLLVMNESASFLALDLGVNGQPIVQPWFNRRLFMPDVIQDVAYTVPTSLAVAAEPSSQVYIEAFGPMEPPSPGLDGPIVRQTTIGVNSVLLFSQRYTAQTVNVAVPLSGCDKYAHLLILVTLNALAGPTPQVTFSLDFLDAIPTSTNTYTIWTQVATTAPSSYAQGIGPGSNTVQPIPPSVVFQAVINPANTTSYNFDVSIYGKSGD